ncbi:MAG: hypothetical protein COT38_04350 [Candidatus Omnitrophica bacterium CG08_land_8_20_14_0_20_41_16]|nr:MAG: hypothetical protein COT38_04350 [Candidatus Omnitrophica bacterium CG08_land_8_20_14_0_20_41_16]
MVTSAPTSGATFTVDNTAPTNQDTVFAASVSKQGAASVTVVSSADDTNNIWFAPSGTTSFSAGATMTTAGGLATTISAPATAGAYQMFVIDAAGNYSTASTATLTVDNTAPTVAAAGVSSTLANGAYKLNQVVPVTVTFTEAVTVTGTPRLTLSTGSPATTAVDYASGSTTTVLTFNYTVSAGNTSADLDYVATSSLALNAGAIADAAGNNATLTLASPAATGSLGVNKALVIDTTNPITAEVTIPVNGTTYKSVPVTFTGNAADNSGGSGLNADSTAFYIKDTGNSQYWDGNSWENSITWLATTHDATTSSTSVSWTDNITLPTWTNNHTYEVKARATDEAGNTLQGTAVTFTYSPNTASALHDGTTENILPALSQVTGGSGKITITFKIKDAEANACSVVAGSFYYQVASGSWTSISDSDITGTKTNLSSATDMSGAAHTLIWDNSREYIDNAVYSNVKIRFKINDGTDNSDYGTSPSGFNVDNSNLGSTSSLNDMVDGSIVTITTSNDTDTSTSTVNIPITGQATVAATVSISISNSGTVYYTGSTTANNAGDWTSQTIGWRPGRSTVTVTVNSAAHSFYVDLVDPKGTIYNALTGSSISGATVSIYDATTNNLASGIPGGAIQVTSSDGAYSFLCPAGSYYLRVTATGYTGVLPGSSIITVPAGNGLGTTSGSADGSYTDIYYGANFTVAATPLHFDVPLDPTGGALFSLSKAVNKKEVVVGDVVTYTLTIVSNSSVATSDLRINDRIPAGFKYIAGKVLLNGNKISDPSGTGTRNLYFNISNLAAGSTTTLKYQLVVGSGVAPGNYSNTAYLERQAGSSRLSNIASAEVKVVLDPLFDLGTVIGKVFHDRNENGIQDKGEEPIPDAQIATEEGTLITADKDGKFHLAAIIPGRHLFRLDERTLPKGAYLTTDKVVIVDITDGLLAKVNFGVKLAEGKAAESMPLTVIQQKGSVQPRLNVALYKDEIIKDANNKLLPAVFHIFTNYSLFIKKWKLEILDKDTKSLVRAFEGSALDIYKPVQWDGKDKYGKPLTEDREYVYKITVTGKDNRQDITKERPFDIKDEDSKITKTEQELKKEKEDWVEKEGKVNNPEKQNIKIQGEVILVGQGNQAVALAANNIRITRLGKIEGEFPIIQKKGLTAKELLDNPAAKDSSAQSQTIDIIVPDGEYDIEGKHIKVGENYLFFVAMGDTKMGYSHISGNIEPAQQNDQFQKGFWSEGKLAYYLKGKIKGKYLITSSLDTERDKKELFRNLDPNKYYPVYGDSSSINYSATDTQGPFYLLIEWDKSSAMWGNYNTAFTDTEFIQFNRSLYGGKLHYETVSTTQFGEPKTKFVVFKARAQQKASHNEFIGTGGSLYYLKNKDIIEGSDKVKIEVRDKITGLVLATKEMVKGTDYDINYSNGRIIFFKPISQISESESIISNHLLDGNPVYVVSDYEYELKDKYDEGTVGVRLQKSLSDYLIMGGTYVKEEQLDKNYELKGIDNIVHLGKNIKFTGEYAESKSEATGSFISTDGGLSFTELATGDLDKGKAYGLKGEAYLLSRLGLTSYYKKIEKGFSSSATSSQQGKELIGGGITLDISSKTRLKATHDIQRLLDSGNLQAQLQIGAKKTETTVAQVTHEATEKLKLTGEYRHQEVTERKEEFASETNAEEDIIAAKLDYKATKRLGLSLEQQASLKGAPDYQTSAGISTEVNKFVSLRAKQAVGNNGAATSLGATANLKDKFEVTSDYTLADYGTTAIGDTASIGGKVKLDEKTEVFGTHFVTDSGIEGKKTASVFGVKKKLSEKLESTFEKEYASTKNETSNSNIFGLSGDINDKWAGQGSFERGIVQNFDGTQAKRNAGTLGLSYVDKDNLKASSKIELRLDQGNENKRQYVLYNAVETKINPNTTLFAKANISQSQNTTANSTQAQYKELTTGLAYRPVNFDRLNLLARYTYLEDDAPSGQSDFSDIDKEKSHIIAGESVYDLTDKWQLVEKLAYKMGEEKVTGFDFTKTQTWLMIHRLNYNINKDWQVGAEYRRLTQKQAKDYKQGALVEVARKVGEFIQVGLGYNFTNFNDDLTHLDYTAQGPFIRLTAKFYDRTPEEIERARQKWLESMVKLWAWELVNNELAHPDSLITREIYRNIYLAQQAHSDGRLEESLELYEKILQIGKNMYNEAEEYIKGRIALEGKLKEDNVLALAYHKEGKLKEAEELWGKILEEANPKPIYLEVTR